METKIISGYKAFNYDMTNRYDFKFRLGKVYTCANILKFGSNGFHLCKNLEDTLRYFDGINSDIKICKVRGIGDYELYEDEYYGYYDMYCFRKIIVDEIMSYNDIIKYINNTSIERKIRFVSGYKLKDEDINKFKSDPDDYNKRLYKYVRFYQENDKYAFER